MGKTLLVIVCVCVGSRAGDMGGGVRHCLS